MIRLKIDRHRDVIDLPKKRTLIVLADSDIILILKLALG